MVTAKLLGGMCNQLFIISATYTLAKENNDECAFDFYHGTFTQKPAHAYKDILYNGLAEVDLLSVGFNIYNEPHFHYRQIPYRPNMLLNGYFQSEKYFIKYRTDLLNIFKNKEIISVLSEKYKNILSNSLAIHVRRGDYLKLQHYHPCPTLEYYNNAIKYIDTQKEIKNILVFSDDINWCKSNFNDGRITFIENQQDYEDLFLMSLCENNIIANSSFSWWGAWMNENNNNKIVIAPKIWFGEVAKANWSDIYFEKTIIM
jgi:hypothetical protein